MTIYGYIIVIKRIGGDYTSYPLTTDECIIGRYTTCDIRVQIPAVSKIHCAVKINNLGSASLTNLTAHNFTIVNDEAVTGFKTVTLFHNDVIMIADRKFRWEYPEGSKLFFKSRSDQQSGSPGFCMEKNVQRSLEDRSKKVSFGPYLSPEHFDLNFPPSTPVRKGQKPPELDDLNSSQNKYLSPKISSIKKVTDDSINETPSKSLLKRHSPTPIKPSIARRLGLLANLSNSSPVNSKAGNIDDAKHSTPKKRGTKRKRKCSSSTATHPSKRMKLRLRNSTGSKKISKTTMSSRSIKNVKKKRFSDAVIRGNMSKIPLPKSQRSHAILHYKVQQRKAAQKVPSKMLRQKKTPTLKSDRISSNQKNSLSSKVSPAKRLLASKPTSVHKKTSAERKSCGRPKSIGNISVAPNPKLASLKKRLPSAEKKSRGRPKSIGNIFVTPNPKKISHNTSLPSKFKLASLPSKVSPKLASPAKKLLDSKLTSVHKKTSAEKKSRGRPKSIGNIFTTPNPKKISHNTSLPSKFKLASLPSKVSPKLASPAKRLLDSKLTSAHKKTSAEKKSRGRPKSIGNISTNPKKISSPNTSLPSKLKHVSLPNISATPVSKKKVSSPKSLSSTSKSLGSLPNISVSSDFKEKMSLSPHILDSSKTLSHTNGSSSKWTPPNKKLSDSPQSTRSLPISHQTSQRANNLPKSGLKTSRVSTSSRPRGRPRKSRSLSHQGISRRVNLLDGLKFSVTNNELTPLKGQPIKSSPHSSSEKSTSERLSTSLRKAAKANGTTPKSPTRLLVLSRKTVNSPPRVSASIHCSPKSPSSQDNFAEHLVTPETKSSKLNLSSEMFSVSPNSFLYSSSLSPSTPQSGRKSRLSDISSLNPSLHKSDLTPDRKISSLISIMPNETSLDFSFSKTPNVTMDKFVSPLESNIPVRMVPESISRLDNNPVKEKIDIPLDSDMTLFEFDTRVTPDVSGVVSPLNTTQKQSNKSYVQPLQDCNMTKSIQKLFESSDKTDAAQLRKLFTESITPQKNESMVDKCVSQLPHLSNIGSRTSTPNPVKPLKKLRKSRGVTSDSFRSRSYERTNSLKENNFERGLKMSQRSFNMTPELDYPSVTDLKKLMKSPSTPKETLKGNSNIYERKRLLRTSKSPKLNYSSSVGFTGLANEPRIGPLSPKMDCSNVNSVKRLIKTPRPESLSPKANYSHVHGLKKLVKTPRPNPESPKADYSNVHGLKRLMNTPRPNPESPKADYSNVHGLKRLMKTPRPDPESPKADYSNVHGLKRLVKTPRPEPKSPQADYSNVHGLKRLMKTPRPNPESPKADYSNVHGLKRLMKTPRPESESPKADYSNVHGLKRLMKTPRPESESFKADYSNVHGLKRLVTTPRPEPESPKADYSNVHGLKRLMKTPRLEKMKPEADYNNVCGVKRLLKTPKPQGSSPKADYTDAHDLKRLLTLKQSPNVDLTKIKCLRRLLKMSKLESMNDINIFSLKKIMAENPKFSKRGKFNSEYNLFDLKRLFKSPAPKLDGINMSEVQGLENLVNLFTTPPTPFNSPSSQSSGGKSPKYNVSLHSPEVEVCAPTPSPQIANEMLTPHNQGQSNKQRLTSGATSLVQDNSKSYVQGSSVGISEKASIYKSPKSLSEILMPDRRGEPNKKSPSLTPRTRGRPKGKSHSQGSSKKESPSLTLRTRGRSKIESPSLTPRTRGRSKMESPSLTPRTRGRPKKESPSLTPRTRGRPKKESPSLIPRTRGRPKKESSMTPGKERIHSPKSLSVEELRLPSSKSLKETLSQTPSPTKSISNKPERQTRKKKDIKELEKYSPQMMRRCVERKKIPEEKSLQVEIEPPNRSTISQKAKVESLSLDAPVTRTTRGRKAKNPDSSVPPVDAPKSPATRTTRGRKAKNPDSSVPPVDAPKSPATRTTRGRKAKNPDSSVPPVDAPKSPAVKTPPKRNTRQRKAVASTSPQVISSRITRATRSRR